MILILYVLFILQINHNDKSFSKFVVLAICMLVLLIIGTSLVYIKKSYFNLFHTILMFGLNVLLILSDDYVIIVKNKIHFKKYILKIYR